MLLALPLSALTAFETTRTCPLDGTEFKYSAVRSYSVFNRRLDFKPIGACPAPFPIPQCPKCSFPIYGEFNAGQIEHLKSLVASERFQTEGKGKSAHLALGVLQELQNEPPETIAWTYVQAMWAYNHPKEISPSFIEVAKRTIAFYDAAAKDFQNPGNDKKRAEAHSAMLYLPIELSRLAGDFDEAARRLEAAAPLLAASPINEMPQILAYQRKLIARKDSAPHLIGEWESEDPVPSAADVKEYLRYRYNQAEQKQEWLPVSKEDGDAVLTCLRNFKAFPKTGSGNNVANPLPADANIYMIRADGGTNCFVFYAPSSVHLRTRGESRRTIPLEERTALAQIIAKWQNIEINQVDLSTLPCQYRVGSTKGGDTLSGIAKLFYKDATKWRVIYEANKAAIKNPDTIRHGMLITIPKPED